MTGSTGGTHLQNTPQQAGDTNRHPMTGSTGGKHLQDTPQQDDQKTRHLILQRARYIRYLII